MNPYESPNNTENIIKFKEFVKEVVYVGSLFLLFVMALPALLFFMFSSGPLAIMIVLFNMLEDLDIIGERYSLAIYLSFPLTIVWWYVIVSHFTTFNFYWLIR